jgi:hypothetical protein
MCCGVVVENSKLRLVLVRGPLVLARDQRLASGDVDQPVALKADQYVDVTPLARSRWRMFGKSSRFEKARYVSVISRLAATHGTRPRGIAFWMPLVDSVVPLPEK